MSYISDHINQSSDIMPGIALEAADEIERLEKELAGARLEIATSVLDCRTCNHYRQEYLPCHSVAKCDHGNLWKRGKVVQIWEK